MPEFVTNTIMCKAVRTTRLYQSVYDTKYSDVVLPESSTFLSKKQYKSDASMMYYISESKNGNAPEGYWCPDANLQIIPVIVEDPKPESIDPNGIKSVDCDFVVKASGVKTYATFSTTKECPNGLQVGDTLKCDKMIEVTINGVDETRYRIANVGGVDQTLEGVWVASDRAIGKKDGKSIVLHNPVITKQSAPVRKASRTQSRAASQASNNGGGTTYTAPSGETFQGVETETFTTESGTNVTVSKVDVTNVKNLEDLYERYGFDYYGVTTTESLMGVPVGRMLFVHGMPFQYTYITDRRPHASERYGKSAFEDEQGPVKSGTTDMYGRSFAKDIAANMPIATIIPGKPKFLTSVRSGMFARGDEGDARDAWTNVFQTASDSDAFGSVLAGLQDIDGDYQYYSLEIDTATYFEYVNSLCRTSARLMGLSKVRYRGVTCDNMDWGQYNKGTEQDYNMLEEVLGLAGGVSFAFDPESSVSDTIGNTTTESQFAQFFDDISGKVRELEFILGYSGSGFNEWIDSANYKEAATSELKTGAFSGAANAISRIGDWMENTAHGMNMRFPEIWQNSSHTRSYDIEMHFLTPYATAFCKWRYVLVPFFHIFALAAPKSDTNMSQYSTPFLIRAYSKGYFNVEMGIIESLTWKRFGDGDMISEDGVPTQIDVTVSFKDLYHVLAMTNMYAKVDGTGVSNVQNFFNNTGLMDLIGTLSGVNMNRVSLQERISMFASSNADALGSLGGNFMRHISDRVRNITSNLLYGRVS